MSINFVTPSLSVSTQLLPADIPDIHAQGFRSILCNRPDNEGPDQPAFTDIERLAAKYGVVCQYQPVVSGKVSRDDADTFANVIQSLPSPTLAYCRTGTRCITLWAMANVASLGADTVRNLAQRAGYDVSEVVQ